MFAWNCEEEVFEVDGDILALDCHSDYTAFFLSEVNGIVSSGFVVAVFFLRRSFLVGIPGYSGTHCVHTMFSWLFSNSKSFCLYFPHPDLTGTCATAPGSCFFLMHC